MSEQDTDQVANDAIEEVLRTKDPLEDSILTGWVVVAEWMDSDGEMYLTRRSCNDMSAWKRDGMLTWAQDNGGE